MKPADKIDPEGNFPRSDLSDEENNKRRAKLGDGGAWNTDATFNALAKSPFHTFRRMSYQCGLLLDHDSCDRRIHYRFKKFKSESIDASTGIRKIEFEDYEWNTTFESIQIEGGSQSRGNTPEGSPCQCMCHDTPRRPVGRMSISDKLDPHQLSEEDKKKLV